MYVGKMERIAADGPSFRGGSLAMELRERPLLLRTRVLACDKLVSLQLGDAVIMATQAALAALVAMQPSVPKPRKALKSPKPAKQPLLAKSPRARA